MLAALPPGVLHLGHELTSFTDAGDRVILHLRDRPDVEADVLVGGDGINSTVRRQLWGDQPIRHQKLHLVGGYVFRDDVQPVTVVAHNRTTQGSYSAIRHEGRNGYEWWVLEACDPAVPFTEDPLAFARRRARGFAEPLPSLIEATPPEHLQRWEIRDRKPLSQWSKGRATILGDAAHPTSPYAAYGAGMSIEDGYFLAAELEQVSLADTADVRCALQAFEERRKKHTAQVAQQAYYNGIVFHRLPASCGRCAISSWTTRRCPRRSSAMRCRPRFSASSTKSTRWSAGEPRTASRSDEGPGPPQGDLGVATGIAAALLNLF
jgi:2-polyprenyl-6-methoxyphenol hydroxylase-like FAD-dependent oxidoreductase